MAFRKATKHEAKLRLALIGPSGSGKTYTALTIAAGLGEKIAVVDTERGSASKYADLFGFDVLELTSFSPRQYIDAIHEANGAYDVLVIDSLSHAWVGIGGVLEQHDQATKRSRNSFEAWREVTPLHNQLVDAMLACEAHLIVTMRAKTEYAVTTDDKGKMKVEKLGLAPVQRDGLEYEFDVIGDMALDNTLVVSKSRCPELTGQVITKPTRAVADTLKAWLAGAPVAPKQTPSTLPSSSESGAGPASGTGSPDERIGVRQYMVNVLWTPEYIEPALALLKLRKTPYTAALAQIDKWHLTYKTDPNELLMKLQAELKLAQQPELMQ